MRLRCNPGYVRHLRESIMLCASLPAESLSWDYGVRRSLIERTLKRVGGRAEVLNCVIASSNSIDRGGFPYDNLGSKIAANQVECLVAEGMLSSNAHSFLASPRRPAVVISETSTAAGYPTAIPCSRTTCRWEIDLLRESRNQGHECSCGAVQCFPRSNVTPKGRLETYRGDTPSRFRFRSRRTGSETPPRGCSA